MRIRDLFDPGSGMEKFGSGIRYKYPGSATLVPTINNNKRGTKYIICFILESIPLYSLTLGAHSSTSLQE
jgi:hypothetical protein